MIIHNVYSFTMPLFLHRDHFGGMMTSFVTTLLCLLEFEFILLIFLFFLSHLSSQLRTERDEKPTLYAECVRARLLFSDSSVGRASFKEWEGLRFHFWLG